MRLADRLKRLGEAPALTTHFEEAGAIPQALIEGVEEALLAGETHYTVRLGLPELRRRLARELARIGGPSYEGSLDNLLVTAGESEALFVTLLGISPAPGEVLVASSRPRRHQALFGLMGLEVRDAGESAERTGRTRLVYREASSDPEAQRALVRLASSNDLPDVSNLEDLLGRGGAESSRRFPPLDGERTVVLGNLDALPGMSSFRVGFLAGPERWLARIRVWKQALTICSPAPSQRAAWIALGGSEETAS